MANRLSSLNSEVRTWNAIVNFVCDFMHLEHPTSHYHDTDPHDPFRVTDSISMTRNSSETKQEVGMRDSVECIFVQNGYKNSRNVKREIIHIFDKI